MKKLEAIIRPSTFVLVKEALTREGIFGMTVSDVKGCEREDAHVEHYRGVEYVTDYLPKIKLELLLDDRRAERIAEIIEAKAGTGRIGDAKTFLIPVEDAVRIRTGERGKQAI